VLKDSALKDEAIASLTKANEDLEAKIEQLTIVVGESLKKFEQSIEDVKPSSPKSKVVPSDHPELQARDKVIKRQMAKIV
jgi:hypothetical protein